MFWTAISHRWWEAVRRTVAPTVFWTSHNVETEWCAMCSKNKLGSRLIDSCPIMNHILIGTHKKWWVTISLYSSWNTSDQRGGDGALLYMDAQLRYQPTNPFSTPRSPDWLKYVSGPAFPTEAIVRAERRRDRPSAATISSASFLSRASWSR